MKRLLLQCVLLSSLSYGAFAQDVQNNRPVGPAGAPMQAPPRPRRPMPAPEMVAEKRAKMMQNQLGLNADQYKAAYEAELEFAKAFQASTANGSMPGEGQMSQMTMTKDQKYKAVLTADQYTRYDAMKPKMPATPPPPPNR